MCKPRIPLHQYLDTCSLLGDQHILKRRSSDQTSVVQTTINTAKSQFPVILSIIINPVHQFKVLHYIENQLPVINSKKNKKDSNSKIKVDLTPTSPPQFARSLHSPTVIGWVKYGRNECRIRISCSYHNRKQADKVSHVFYFYFYLLSSLLHSSSTCRRFYPQRSSRRVVVTVVVPSPLRYVPSILIAHRVQHSYCSTILIECR